MKDYKIVSYLIGLLCLVSVSLQAKEWSIESGLSRVSFISIKKQDIAEVHHFTKVNAILTEREFRLEIPLSSVDTQIEIRDERMKTFLFEVAKFPKLELSAKVTPEQAVNLEVGQSQLVTVNADISLHGVNKSKEVTVMVSRLSENRLQLASFQPILIKASDFDLQIGVTKLKEIARLSSISDAVPVTFVLSLMK